MCRRMRLKKSDFSNTYEICFFFEKVDICLRKKVNCFKIVEGGKLVMELAGQLILILKNFFSTLIVKLFCKKKSESFQIWKN